METPTRGRGGRRRMTAPPTALGVIKLRRAIEKGFFGRILSIRGEFGYWVFEVRRNQRDGMQAGQTGL